MFSKLFKFLFVVSIVVLLLGAGAYFILNQPIPPSKSGPKAEELTQKMLKAINYTNYKKVRYLEWTFKGKHHYKWNKLKGHVIVKWEDVEVQLNLNNYSKSEVFIQGVKMHTDPKEDLIEEAKTYFINDSFWLVAPFEIMDPNVQRHSVELEDGSEGLLVTYLDNEQKPKNTYLWLLNEDGFPNSFKMWTKDNPIGGLKASWDDWKVTGANIFLPSQHKLPLQTIRLTNLKAYN
ncbi:hypothetical protein I215_10585 [Galbibacter marinus]|uniref:Outer membrane lipoprotein-sorting protein n=1 Tax=Galbibacter marinus TaxID=555500 RepID=K2QJ95_9FLAO|nr:hypothetical protein [Galbibacter marinus]EKF54747.1 hypothetical protein I215_10585 [Galbibacter marinus]